MIETPYNSLIISEYIEDGRTNRALLTDSGKIQGRIFLDKPDEIAAEYQQFIADTFFDESVKSALLLGDSVYALPPMSPCFPWTNRTTPKPCKMWCWRHGKTAVALSRRARIVAYCPREKPLRTTSLRWSC